jgi:hypothetical protein
MPTPVRASNQARATPACPRSTGTRGRTLTLSTMEVNSIAAIRYSLQRANFKVQLASMSSNMQDSPHSTCNKQTWLQPCNA